MLKIILSSLYIVLSVLGMVLVKLGGIKDNIPSFNIPVVDIKMNSYTFIGIVSYGISFILFISIIQKYKLGIILPLLSAAVNVIILLVSFAVLREKLALHSIVGAVIIIMGVFIMNYNR